ncbi:30S ribosomal protein S2 [uncultured archaeon]|nr:30S ribosomal protein S2 [uncultured archaeon]
MSQQEFVIPQDKLLEAGVHIGTKTKHGSMRPYIYKAREDGLHVLDLKKTDDCLRNAAKMLSEFDASGIYVIGSKDNSIRPIKTFCQVIGANVIAGRFTPGRFTNPSRADFVEPTLVILSDPSVDKQALKEAFEINVPVIALCDTNNSLQFVDAVIPTNNKGRKALSLIFWGLAKVYCELKGIEFAKQPADFE